VPPDPADQGGSNNVTDYGVNKAFDDLLALRNKVSSRRKYFMSASSSGSARRLLVVSGVTGCVVNAQVGESGYREAKESTPVKNDVGGCRGASRPKRSESAGRFDQ
jgi:hypothetical protein